MNNAKMWLVVSPSVGVPVFLGAVAVGSFAVHVAVLGKTNWYSDYLVGAPLGSDEVATSQPIPDSDTAKAAYVVDLDEGARELTVVLPDGTVARAILQTDEVLASAPPLIATD